MKRLILILLLFLPCLPSAAQDISSQKARKQKIEKEIEFINSQLRSLSSKQKASTEHLYLIQKKVSGRKALIKETDLLIDETDRKIAEKKEEIGRLSRELDTLSSYYGKLIYKTYRNRDTRVWFMYILASEDIGQGYRRFAYFRNLASEASSQGKVIGEKQAELEKERENLDEIRKEAVTLRSERETEYRKLLEEESQSKKNIKSLSKTQAQYRDDLAKKKKEVDRLNREIEKMLSRAVKKQKDDKTVIDYALNGEFEQNRGKLPWPVKSGVISERFGVNTHPVYKNLKMPQCNGVTFRTDRNAGVFCVFDGEIRQIVVIPGYNQCVLVQHGTYFTFYCKLSTVNVKSGQKISAGDCIGTLDPDGDAGSSLHFQIWKGTEKQNPEKWLRP